MRELVNTDNRAIHMYRISMHPACFLSLAPIIVVAHLIGITGADVSHTLYVSDLDGDAIADTVLGAPTGDMRMLATTIRWGGASSIEHNSVRSQLELHYPRAARLAGSSALEDLNGDGIDDLVIVFDTCDVTSLCAQRALIIVGQKALRSADSIDVATIPIGIQWQPFVALDVVAMSLLSEPAERELSGVTSYSWRDIPLPVKDAPDRGEVHDDLARLTALYPNPAATMATFEAGRLAPGEYVVELLDAAGHLRYARPVVVDVERAVSGTIDLGREAAGAYYVRIRSGGSVVALYPVVVVR